ncbi:MAG: alginate O-acetyltransferase AlgF [Polynucleobacter sp.]|uniref:alginate O-acetyltransferase AlgF n=1 Tax=Polynucleobacter sp. TaxID=2029855 RepID=UPI00301AE6DF
MKLIKIYTSIFAVAATSVGFITHAAEIPLYPTGPSQDSAFVRFINGTDTNLTLTAGGSKAKVALDVNQPASKYYPVNTKGGITGEFSNGKMSSPISLNVKPSEFATIVAFATGGNLKQVIIKEQPDDFNALKSSLALYNLSSAGCASAGLLVIDRAISLFEKVQSGTLQRRLINPINLSVQLTCNAKPIGKALDLGLLQAGQRYSIFAVPTADSPRIFFASDTIAR